MNKDMQLKLTILAMVLEWEVEEYDPMDIAKEMYDWIKESEDQPDKHNVTTLSTVN